MKISTTFLGLCALFLLLYSCELVEPGIPDETDPIETPEEEPSSISDNKAKLDSIIQQQRIDIGQLYEKYAFIEIDEQDFNH